MITSTEYWDIDGVPLETLAYNIVTKGGDLFSPPPMRGEDLVIPYAVGAEPQDRIPDSRTFNLNMWVIGADEDGTVPRTMRSKARFDYNLRMLRKLFWNEGRTFKLTKRWYEYVPATEGSEFGEGEFGDGPFGGVSEGTAVLRTATAIARYDSGFAPAMQGQARATFSVAVNLPKAFFVGAEETVTFDPGSTATKIANILGDYSTTNIVLDVNGARNNFRMTNLTEGHFVNVNDNVANGQLARIDVDAWQAIRNPATTPVNLIGKITQGDHTHWLSLRPGTQVLSLTSSAGTGPATLKYRPLWL